jgi:hypothetical protein
MRPRIQSPRSRSIAGSREVRPCADLYHHAGWWAGRLTSGNSDMSAGAAYLLRQSGGYRTWSRGRALPRFELAPRAPRWRGISVGNQFTSCEPAFEFSGRPMNRPEARARRSPFSGPAPQRSPADKNSTEAFHISDRAGQIILLGASPLLSRLPDHGAHCFALAQEQKAFFRQLRAGSAVRWIM